MAKIRRIIRKLQLSREASFDEQLWPVNVALVVLGAYLMGIAIAVLRFDDPRVLLNAATWVTGVPIIVGSVMWGLTYVRNRTFRRAVQLSIVLSLIINISILVIMAWLKIFRPPWVDQPQVATSTQPQQVITVPEYQEVQINADDRPRQEHEKPVETGSPDANRQEVTRQSTEPQQNQQQPQPQDVPDPTKQVEPHEIARRQVSETAPRHSEQQSKLSRQMSRTQLKSGQPKATPVVTTPPQRQPSRVEAKTATVQRSVTDVQIEIKKRSVDVEPSTVQRQEAVKVARRETQQAPTPESTAAPTMQRRMAQPKAVPRTTAATAEVSAVARQTAPTEPKPNNLEARKQTTASPTTAKATTEPTPETSPRVAEAKAQRQQQADEAPTLAQSPTSVPNRRAPSAQPTVNTVAAADQPTQAPAPSAQPRPTPSASPVSRQASRAPVTQQPSLPSEVPSASPSTQLARAVPRRAQSSQVPTLSDQPQSAPTQTPSRTTRTAAVAASPQAVASPAVAQASRPTSRPTARPARTALAKSTGGVAGIGAAPNMDRGLPAPDTPAMVPSASARRPTSIQRTEAGPAIAPSEPARISRARAGAQAPTASMTAEPVAVATVAGSRQPQPVEASASAALTRSAANAPRAPSTASKGETEVDLGPTRIVANQGRGRAAGGGQPMLNQDTQARAIARSETGGAPETAIVAAATAEVPAAPAGQASGQPTPADTAPQATSLARTEAGGELPTSGGPASAEDAGLPAVAGSAQALADAQIGRAEAVEATPGPVEPGGGTKTPARSATARRFTTNTQAEVVSLAGDPQSSGQPEGAPLEAQGTETARTAAGVTAPATSDPAGALAGPTTVDATTVSEPGAIVGQRQTSPSGEDGPRVADVSDAGAPLRKASTASLPAGQVAEVAVDVPVAGGPSAEPDATAALAAAGTETGPLSRPLSGALPVHAEAPEGPGGVGDEATPDVGMISRQAMQESQDVTFKPARFVRHEVGGPVSVNTTAKVGAKAFDQRTGRQGDPDAGGRGQPSPQTEETVELGLVFLTQHQSPDGSWSLNNFGAGRPGYEEETALIHSDTAGTGLALLAYLGAGYHHRDHKYQDVVRGALDFLVRNQKDDGDLYLAQDPESNRSAWLYSHAISTMAICEAYGMTQDPWLREPAQKALDFIVASQHEDRGGWRYLPGNGSDTSVTGWMLTALKSGDLAYLKVPEEAYTKIDGWLEMSQASRQQRHLYRYNPLAPDTKTQRHGRRPSETMTAVGLLMRLYSGWRREHREMIQGAEYLLQSPPEIGTTRNPKRDTYYWYYATQVMFHMKGKYWEEWNNKLHPLLTGTQIKQGPMAGSWNPKSPVPDRWAPHGGRLYVTTMNLLSLEVYYRHLPLYEESAK